MKHKYSSDELAFLAAIHDNPRDDTVRLVYADWLEEHGRLDESAFLRLHASLPRFLIDGDPPEVRAALHLHLEGRTKLRAMRNGLPDKWLSAIGDEGLVGEIVVYVTHFYGNSVYFGVIVDETEKTVLVARLGRRIVSGDSQNGSERPILPNADEVRELKTAANPMRCQKRGETFTNSRLRRYYHFWTGKDEYFCTD